MISAFFVILIAFLAGVEGILDEFQFHQPLVAATLIGLATGHLMEGVILGGTLQMLALGWMNIGAAITRCRFGISCFSLLGYWTCTS